MSLNNESLFVAFDVDGTLIGTNENGENVPRYKVIELFRHFERLGCTMFIWSGSGVDYATRWAQKLGLKASIVRKGSIVPDITFDDEIIRLGKTNIQV